MRSSLLDIKVAPNGRSPQPATVIRMDIQARNGFRRGQPDCQLQLCVPLVPTSGESVRLSQALAGAGVVALAGTR